MATVAEMYEALQIFNKYWPTADIHPNNCDCNVVCLSKEQADLAVAGPDLVRLAELGWKLSVSNNTLRPGEKYYEWEQR